MKKKLLSLILAITFMLPLVQTGAATSGLATGELLMSLTRENPGDTNAGVENRILADTGFSGELTAWNNNEQVIIGIGTATNRTPIAINNNQTLATLGWYPVSVGDIDTATAFQIKFSTTGYEDIRFSATQKSTGSGPDEFVLAYSLDGISFTEIADSRTGTGAIGAVPRVSNDTYTALQQTYYKFELPAVFDDQAEIFLRVCFDGKDDLGANGNTSINDIRITSGDIDPYPETPIDPLDHIIINQVYGTGADGGGGAVSHSFFELYNPTDTDIALTGKSLQYIRGSSNNGDTPGATEWDVLQLNGVIKAHSSFLVVSDNGVNHPGKGSTPPPVNTIADLFTNGAVETLIAGPWGNFWLNSSGANGEFSLTNGELWVHNRVAHWEAVNVSTGDIPDGNYILSVTFKGETPGRYAIQKGDTPWNHVLDSHTELSPTLELNVSIKDGRFTHANGAVVQPADEGGQQYMRLRRVDEPCADINCCVENAAKPNCRYPDFAITSIKFLQIPPGTPEPARLVIDPDKCDQIWNIPVSNRAFSVALVDGVTALPATGDLPDTVIDLVGVTNEGRPDRPAIDTALYFEDTAFDYNSGNGISRQAAARRINFADTDNNKADFERIDYRTADIQRLKPRSARDGVWGVDFGDFTVKFSENSGFHADNLSLALTMETDDEYRTGVIRYTLDGSEPTGNSPQYTAPVPLEDRTDELPVLDPYAKINIKVEGYAPEGARVEIVDTDGDHSPIMDTAVATANSINRYTIEFQMTRADFNSLGSNFRIWAPSVGVGYNFSVSDIIITDFQNPSKVLYTMQSENLGGLTTNPWYWGYIIWGNGASFGIIGTAGAREINVTLVETWNGLGMNSASLLSLFDNLTPPDSAEGWLAAQTTGQPWGNEIVRGNIVRAAVFDEYGNMLTDRIHTNTYFIGIDKSRYGDLPIISLATDADSLFDWDTGIYQTGEGWIHNGDQQWGWVNANFNQRGDDWERPAHMLFIESNGDLAMSQDIGIRIHGGWSRRFDQKSFRLYARSEYDTANAFRHDVFNGSAIDANGDRITRFDRLLLRNAGTDAYGAHMRDALLSDRLHDYNNMIYQSYRPAILFINGEFWGYYNIRERTDERMVAQNTGFNRDQIAVSEISGGSYVAQWENPGDAAIQADAAAYSEMYNWFNSLPTYDWKTKTGTSMNLSQYQRAQQYLDIDHFIDYWATEMIFADGDWPSNNMRMWRYRTDYPTTWNTAVTLNDGRWRYVMNDVDFSYGLHGEYDEHDYWQRVIAVILEDSATSQDWPHYHGSTMIFRKLMTYPEFREKFIIRSMDIMNTNLRPDVLVGEIEKLENKMSAVMPEHFNRWPQFKSTWVGNTWADRVGGFKYYAGQRQDVYPAQMSSYFGYLGYGGVATLTVQSADATFGHFKVNTIDLSKADGVEDLADWSGKYLNGTRVTIQAVPSRIRLFSHFEIGGVQITQNPYAFNLQSDTTVVAVYKQPECLNCEHMCCDFCKGERNCGYKYCPICNPPPPTGISDTSGFTAAAIAFTGISALLWLCVIRRRVRNL